MTDDLRHALIHLTGPERGESHVLGGENVTIGTGSDADVAFRPGEAPAVTRRHAQILPGEEGWRLEALGDAEVFVNGEPREAARLLPGDVVQLGAGGPLLRLRLQPASSSGYKSLRDALADCVACARYGADSVPARAGLLLEAMPRELFTQTSPRVRTAMTAALLLGLAASGYQIIQSRQLEERLTDTRARLRAVAASLRAEQARASVGPALLDSLRRVARQRRRGDGAAPDGEAPGSALPAALREAGRSVVLVQGAYRFEDPRTGRTARLRPGGGAASGGEVPVSTETEGPPLERRFTGTAFAVTGRGHFVTSRHLVRPWKHDAVARSLTDAGYRPVFHRLRAFLPGRSEPVDLRLVAQSDSADVALLRARDLARPPPPLPLAKDAPSVGESVHLLGYPAGLRALLARSDPGFVASLRRDSAALDPWEVTERLAAEGRISPLTTRGVVGQVTPSAVVYDASTTQGGSGGPLLGPDGRVVAVNMGVMPEFGGSNLGVPIRYVHRLMRKADVSR